MESTRFQAICRALQVGSYNPLQATCLTQACRRQQTRPCSYSNSNRCQVVRWTTITLGSKSPLLEIPKSARLHSSMRSHRRLELLSKMKSQLSFISRPPIISTTHISTRSSTLTCQARNVIISTSISTLSVPLQSSSCSTSLNVQVSKKSSSGSKSAKSVKCP